MPDLNPCLSQINTVTDEKLVHPEMPVVFKSNNNDLLKICKALDFQDIAAQLFQCSPPTHRHFPKPTNQ